MNVRLRRHERLDRRRVTVLSSNMQRCAFILHHAAPRQPGPLRVTSWAHSIISLLPQIDFLRIKKSHLLGLLSVYSPLDVCRSNSMGVCIVFQETAITPTLFILKTEHPSASGRGATLRPFVGAKCPTRPRILGDLVIP